MTEKEKEVPPTVYQIREIYENDSAHEIFSAELDRGLEKRVEFIIIEPTRLGDETGRWISVGNCLHKTAVITGLASVITGLVWPKSPSIYGTLCFISAFNTGLYTISWNSDPCVLYQVERNPKKLARIPNINEFSSPTVLVLKDNKLLTILHRSVSILAFSFCAYKFYESFK